MRVVPTRKGLATAYGFALAVGYFSGVLIHWVRS